jgi:hypothetical protein
VAELSKRIEYLTTLATTPATTEEPELGISAAGTARNPNTKWDNNKTDDEDTEDTQQATEGTEQVTKVMKKATKKITEQTTEQATE